MQRSTGTPQSQSRPELIQCTGKDVSVRDPRAAQLVLALGIICSKRGLWKTFLYNVKKDLETNPHALKINAQDIYYMMYGAACMKEEEVEYLTNLAIRFVGVFNVAKMIEANAQNNAQNNNSEEEYNTQNNNDKPPLINGGGRRPAKTSKNAKKTGSKRAAPRK